MADGGDDAATRSASVAGHRRGAGLQRAVVLVLVLAGAVFGAREVHERLTHVHETDARIDAELITVSSRVAGRVVDVPVAEGDTVEEDDVLARIDDRESRLLAEQLEAQLRSVESERERLLAERRLIDEQTSTRYETQLSRMEAAEASVQSLEPQLELARSELERAQRLFEQRVIPKQQLDQARTTARRIDGEYRQAVAELRETRARLQEERAERARLEVLDGELAMLGHREEQLRAQLEQQRIDVSDRTIRSPVAGVVDRIFVDSGEYVTSGQRLLLVHDPDRIWIEANVKETEIRKLDVGQRVEVTIDAYPDETFEGRVESIGSATTASFALLPNPNPSGNFTKITQRLPVRIAIEQRGKKLRPGMMVEIRIDVRDR